MNGHGRDFPGAAARWIVRLRYLLAPVWIALSVLALVYLPSIFEAKTGTLHTLLSSEAGGGLDGGPPAFSSTSFDRTNDSNRIGRRVRREVLWA